MLREQVNFPRAVEILGGAAEPDPERAAALERELEEKREKAELDSARYRERARESAFDIWRAGEPFAGSPAERYLKECRSIVELPAGLKLRFAPALAFCHGQETDEFGRKSARVIHIGPAMLAPIVDAAGKFRAVHRTYLDFDRPNGKALIVDPKTGEEIKKNKKSLGSVGGNAIRLIEPPGAHTLLYIGEGIETVLSAWYALRRAGVDLAATLFWSAVDLGNLAGKALASVPHPTSKDARGRACKIPGPQPDLTRQGISVPSEVSKIVLLGDGDSDAFLTDCALARASLRFAATG
jgi:hypothetical protein